MCGHAGASSPASLRTCTWYPNGNNRNDNITNATHTRPTRHIHVDLLDTYTLVTRTTARAVIPSASFQPNLQPVKSHSAPSKKACDGERAETTHDHFTHTHPRKESGTEKERGFVLAPETEKELIIRPVHVYAVCMWKVCMLPPVAAI